MWAGWYTDQSVSGTSDRGWRFRHGNCLDRNAIPSVDYSVSHLVAGTSRRHPLRDRRSADQGTASNGCPRGPPRIHLIPDSQQFCLEQQIGARRIRNALLAGSRKNLQRRPDLAFVSYERWAHDRAIPAEPAWEVVPNLAIEVISPKNFANDVVQKIEDYFVSGVERVWVIYPLVAKVYDYESPSSVRILAPKDLMQAEAVLPGLEIPLTDLFDTGTKPK